MQNFVHICGPQGLLDKSRSGCNVQLSSDFADFSLAHHQDSDAGAVQDGNLAEVKNNVLGSCCQYFREFQFHVTRTVAQDDSPGHFQHRNIRRELFCLDSQNQVAPLGASVVRVYGCQLPLRPGFYLTKGKRGIEIGAFSRGRYLEIAASGCGS